MTESEVKAFRALADAATAPPWSAGMTHVGSPSRAAVASRMDGKDADFIAAARNVAAKLCDAALYALELERIVHDIQRGEAADLIAEARRQGREEGISEAYLHDSVPQHYAGRSGFAKEVLRLLPPLPAEPPTNHELRARAAALEAILRAAVPWAERLQGADYRDGMPLWWRDACNALGVTT